MIVAAIVIINPDIASFTNRFPTREAISLEEALLGEFSPRSFDFNWLPTDEHLNGDLILYEESKNLYLATLPLSGERKFRSADNPNKTVTITSLKQPTLNYRPNTTILISNSSLLASIKYQGYKLSPSRRFLLVWTARKRQFRHSFTAKYFIYDIKLDLISSLSTRVAKDSESSNQYEQLDTASLYLNDQFYDQYLDNDEFGRFQQVEWFTPNNPLSNGTGKIDSLIMMQNNNIFVLNNVAELGSSVGSQTQMGPKRMPIRLTSSGKPHEYFNGVANWLYEEEILGHTPAFQVSPNGHKLAYMSFNDSQVSSMPYTIYGDQVIPRIQRIRYPKAGQPNPRVSVQVVENLAQISAPISEDHNSESTEGISQSGDNREARIVSMRLPHDLAVQQHYIYRINWLTEDKLALIWSNRYQNESHVLICSANEERLSKREWDCKKNLLVQARNGWLDISDDIYPLDDEFYLALLPKFEGSHVGSFKHLAKVSMNEENRFVYLTSGEKEVLEINGLDSEHSLVYYTSTVVGGQGQRQLFVVNLGATVDFDDRARPRGHIGQSSTRAAGRHWREQWDRDLSVCVTCQHYPTECQYNFARMSPSARHYVFQCDGPDVPRTELRSTRRFVAAATAVSNAYQSSASSPNSNPKPQFETPTAQSDRRPSRTDTSHSRPSDSISSGQGIPPQSLTANASDHQSQAGEAAQSAGQQLNWSPPALISNANGRPNDAGAKFTDIPFDSDLLWTLEDNKELRDRLLNNKALPLEFRLKVPIANTSYQADVLILLPPQLGATGTFQKTSSAANWQNDKQSQGPSRSRRSASRSADLNAAQNRPLYSHYTVDTIQEFIDQLPSGQQYPMVVDVYGGPGSQKVDYRYSVYFGHYLATSRRTIYAMIDGRGSGFQGTNRLYELYHRLGSVEIQDQIDVVQYLSDHFPFIDSTKVAIWGWSYGGYASAMALAQSNLRSVEALQSYIKSHVGAGATRPNNGEQITTESTGNLDRLKLKSSPTMSSIAKALRTDSSIPVHSALGLSSAPPPMPSLRGVFECAASVAPVTSWILYDTAYTERYMGSPWPNDKFDDVLFGDHEEASNQSSFSLDGSLSSRDSTLVGIHQEAQKPDNHAQRPQSLPNKLIEIITAKRNTTLERDGRRNHSTISIIQGSKARKGHYKNNIYDLNKRYEKASLLEHIANIDSKRFLLIHGTSDDNVHFQQSIMLMKRLIQKNILFETRIYPDQDHGIGNKADKLHLGMTLSNFFAECFNMAY